MPRKLTPEKPLSQTLKGIKHQLDDSTSEGLAWIAACHYMLNIAHMSSRKLAELFGVSHVSILKAAARWEAVYNRFKRAEDPDTAISVIAPPKPAEEPTDAKPPETLAEWCAYHEKAYAIALGNYTAQPTNTNADSLAKISSSLAAARRTLHKDAPPTVAGVGSSVVFVIPDPDGTWGALRDALARQTTPDELRNPNPSHLKA